MKTGDEVKKELQKLIATENYKKAQDIARDSLKNCQNFIKDFKVGTTYHLLLEKAISDLNSVLCTISNKVAIIEKERNDINQSQSEAENKKYFKTKILSEEIRENASKIAEADLNFDDFAKTSYGFEKAYNSMKKRQDVFFKYLNHLSAKTFVAFYQNNELSYQTLIGVLSTLKAHCLESKDSASLGLEFLLCIPKTKNFVLIKKFFKKSDKEDLKLFLVELKNKFGELIPSEVDLEKLYF
jgi:hypothetical protein